MNLLFYIIIVGCISYTSPNKILDFVCREKVSKINDLENNLKNKIKLIDEMKFNLTKTTNNSNILTQDFKNLETKLGKCTNNSKTLTSTLNTCKTKALDLEHILTLIKNVIEQAFTYIN